MSLSAKQSKVGLVLSLGLAVSVLAACGTREPDRAFGLQSGTGVTTSGVNTVAGGTSGDQATTTDPGTAGDPGAATDPGAVATAGPVGDQAGGGTTVPVGGSSAAAVAPGAVTPGGVTPSAGPAATLAPGAKATAQPGAKTTGSAKPGATTKASVAASKNTSTGTTAANTASDVGVTPTQITVCNVLTQGGAFGPYEFTPSYYGAAAYFNALNAAGGINGRTVRYVQHVDDGSSSGNSTQVHTCIDTEKAFAFVANNIYQYGGASYVNQMDIPDIGGQPISSAYYQYPHLYTILGDLTERNGTSPGTNNMNYASDELALDFKTKLGASHLGVIAYDQASSEYGASSFTNAFKAAGVTATVYPVNLGLPNFSSAVAQMQSDGVDLVADAIDVNGNQKLCQAIEQNSGFLSQMKAKLSTVSSWSNRYAQSLSQTPNCLAKTYAYTHSENFADAGNPEVAKFQAAMQKYFPSQVSTEHQWMLEGWAAAEWFSDAAKSCGANLTRACVETFMNRPVDYTANGLLSPYTSKYTPQPASFPGSTVMGCDSVGKWDGTKWATFVDMNTSCRATQAYAYTLQPPS